MDLTIVICAYNMARELPRTILTLAAGCQRELGDLSYEIVVIDHGSADPIDASDLVPFASNVSVLRVDSAPISPVAAINAVMAQAAGELLALWIDGARMASPGLIGTAVRALRADPKRIVGSLGFHLGPDVQMRSVQAGYNQEQEDLLLASVPWERDGYQLFSIAVLAGSSSEGWFGNMAESNAVFFHRDFWQATGGLDTRFQAAGGGLVNLDFWSRAIACSGHRPWILLGEGTFHQVHGGAATNGTEESRRKMHEEYEALFGRPFSAPRYAPQFIGGIDRSLAIKFGAV